MIRLFRSQSQYGGSALVLRVAGESGCYVFEGRALTQAIESLDRIAVKHRPSLDRRANDLQEALRLQGVDLGPDATEALVKALASLEGGPQ